MTTHTGRRVLLRLAHARAGTRTVYAFIASVLTAWLLPPSLSREVRAVASWDGFAIVALALTWYTILTVPAR